MKLTAIAAFLLCAASSRSEIVWRAYMRAADRSLVVLSIDRFVPTEYLAKVKEKFPREG
jgi:hypothetical protein